MNTETKRYLVLITFTGDAKTRLQQSAEGLRLVMAHYFKNSTMIVHHGHGTLMFAVKTKLYANQIYDALVTPEIGRPIQEPIYANDKVMIVEIGQDFTAKGFSGLFNWLGVK